MRRFDHLGFTAKIDSALARVRTLLERTRNPTIPADVPHAYDDKFLLTEFVTRVANASALQCLELIGLSSEGLAELRRWASDRTVTLRFSAEETCRHDREETRNVESPEIVTETRGTAGSSVRSEKIVAKITEHYWVFEFVYEIVAYRGNEPERAVALLTRRGSFEIKTTTKEPPRPSTVVRPLIEVEMSWLVRHLDADARPAFAIDRAHVDCHTPRRNRDVDAALDAMSAVRGWCASVVSYLAYQLIATQTPNGRDLSALNAAGLFVPVVPFFEGATSTEDGILPPSYATALLDEERRSLSERCRALATAFPNDGSALTAVEAGLMVTLLHLQEVVEQFHGATTYVEDMLRKQLVAAIGKEVTPVEFTAFMDFHYRKLVKEPYRPRPFSYAVRRPGHDPEGVVSIESSASGDMPEPVSTIVASSSAARPMEFALDASTRVSFFGARHLHGWIGHRFSGESGLAARLVARARQFSSFVLLVGRIASADTFEPKYGIVLRNKDVVDIPLLLEDVPTPKQFRDAIESLSPEQQRFARAFRAMQLESTLFGVVVIQIKPQLEKLLGLAPDSLTKEIQLTEDLLALFADYQIPSDLLSYDGPPEAPAADKVQAVTHHVSRMREMIAASKEREIAEAREREAKRLADLNRTPYPPPGMGPPPAPGGYAPPMGMAIMSAPSFSPPPAMAAMAAPPRPAAPPAAFGASAPTGAPPMPASPAQATSATTGSAARSPHPSDATAAHGTVDAGGSAALDYTRIPGILDSKFEALDDDAALHSTILRPGDVWSRTTQRGLLSAPTTLDVDDDDQLEHRRRAFDLLDALTKSGALSVDEAELHVVLAATHAFDKTLLETVIQDNVNPIEKVERSLLIVATTLFGLPASDLLADAHRERFFTTSPRLRDLTASGASSDGTVTEPEPS